MDASRDPLPPDWDPTLVNFANATTRTLGVFMGSSPAVAEEWHKRLTLRVKERFNVWRRNRMPATLYGKSLAVKNSVLAMVWYLIGHQTPPDNALDRMMSQWQTEAYDFLDQSLHAAELNQRGSTIISRRVLIQDHPEQGARITDVESTARAQYARWAQQLGHPPHASYKHLVLHYINAHYGHLRQGFRLLHSTCDFLNLGREQPFWRNALISSGMFPIMPNPQVDNPTDPTPPTIAQADIDASLTPPSATPPAACNRTSTVRPHWTPLEALVEPLHYNCNLGGDAGARIADPPHWIRDKRATHMNNCHLLRISPKRRAQADKYYSYTVRMAKAGLTHVAHLLAGYENDQQLHWLSHHELEQACRSTRARVPCDAAHLQLLISSIPPPIKSALELLITLKRPGVTLTHAINSAPTVPHTWFQLDNLAGTGKLNSDPAGVTLTHRITPLGTLEPTAPSHAPRAVCTQIHVWSKTYLAHNTAQEEARQRAVERGEPDPFPPILLTSGPVADLSILPGSHPFARAGVNPVHFCLPYSPTDRHRPPVALSAADVSHLYHIQTSDLYAPIRTLDPEHRPTTATSTSYAHLLDVPQQPPVPPAKVRLDITTAAIRAQLPPVLQETQLHVRSDSLHVGDRCTKRGPTKGICDLCYCLLGARTPETTKHICLDCP